MLISRHARGPHVPNEHAFKGNDTARPGVAIKGQRAWHTEASVGMGTAGGPALNVCCTYPLPRVDPRCAVPGLRDEKWS